MKSSLHPYINFRGNTRQAMEFYHSVFDGKLDMNTFKEFHMAEDPSEENLIMHSMLEAPNGISFMAADVPARMEYQPGNNFSMSLSGDNDAELSSYYEKLCAGGRVVEPLKAAPWGDKFGMLVDQFGISWMVNISPQKG